MEVIKEVHLNQNSTKVQEQHNIASPIAGGGGSGQTPAPTPTAMSLESLTNVEIDNPTQGQDLEFDATSRKWKNKTPSGGGYHHNYSTTEQVVGTWIDGKPIYEITIELSSYVTISNNDWTSIGILASSLSINKFIHCTAYTSTGTCWEAINVANISGNIALTAWRNGDTINVDVVVLQYTKTID